MQMGIILATGIGGGLGAIARLLLSAILPARLILIMPIQILLINVLGCYAMGVITELFALYLSGSIITQTFLTTGFLGGFTTFSSFSLEFGLLIKSHHYWLAIIYVLLSVGLGLIGFFLGAKTVKLF